ncbi:MAG: DUF222 domain-containing protein [Frankiales bacterium]|nr:MAG: DUF222 domain-containing protein [Frankiales bacterium]
MFEERGDSWEALAAEPVAPPRPRQPESYADDFCASVSEPGWGATVGDKAVPVSPEIAALEAAIAAVAAVDPAGLDPAQALADAAGVLASMQSLKVAAMTRVADVEKRKLHRLDGVPTVNRWLRQGESGLTAADVTLARRLPTLPTVAEAVAARRLYPAAAQRIAAALVKLRRWVDRPDGLIDGQPAVQVLEAVICDGVRNQVCQALGGLADDDPRLAALVADLSEIESRPVSEIARLEAAFVLLAQQIEPGLLRDALGMLVDALLPSELERRTRDAHDDRGFGFTSDFDGGGWHITDGDLDCELGELLHEVLKAMMATDPENPADTEAYRAARADGWTDADGDEALAGQDAPAPRSRRQRQHDALKRALRLLLDSGMLGLRDKVAPHISVLVDGDGLHDAPGAAPAVGGSGARLPRWLVRKTWCDSAVSRFVMSLGRRVIETSHTERTLKPHERKAKRIETGGRCQCAGCRSGPGSVLIPHHPEAWAKTGTTSFWDTVLLCEADHTRLHLGETIRLRDGRLLNQHGWVTG